MSTSEKDSLVSVIAERAKEDRDLAIAAFAAGDDEFCFRWSMGSRSPAYRGTKFYADGSNHEQFIGVDESTFGAMVREAIATARAQGRRQVLEEALARFAKLLRYDIGGECDGDSGRCRASMEIDERGPYVGLDDVTAAIRALAGEDA